MVRGPQVVLEICLCGPLRLNMYLVKTSIFVRERRKKNHSIVENHKVTGFPLQKSSFIKTYVQHCLWLYVYALSYGVYKFYAACIYFFLSLDLRFMKFMTLTILLSPTKKGDYCYNSFKPMSELFYPV